MALYCACEPDDFSFDGVFDVLTSGTPNFDPAYGVRNALRNQQGVSATVLGVGTFSSDFWVRFRFHIPVIFNNSFSELALLRIKDAGGDDVIRLAPTSLENIGLQLKNSQGNYDTYYERQFEDGETFFVDIGLQDIGGSEGVFGLYLNNEKVFEITDFDLTSFSNISGLVFGTLSSNPTDTTLPIFSEVIWGDEPTVEARVALAAPTGDGFYQEGDGGFNRVDEIVPDGSVIAFDAPNERSSFTQNTLSIITGFQVRNVQVNSFARYTGGGGADDIRAFLRIGSTNYDNPVKLNALSSGYEHYRADWLTDPSTGSLWTIADATSSALEFGIKTED